MRRVVILTMLLLGASVAPASAGFETPEDAVREYLAGVSDADIDRVLSASAADEMRDGFRLSEHMDWIGAYSPVMPGPVHEPFFAEIQQIEWQGQLLGQARMLAYSLLAPAVLGEVLDGQTIVGVDAGWADGLEIALDTSRLSGLVVADIALPEPELYRDPRNTENNARLASIAGADEATDRVVLLTFEDDNYLVGFRLLRYGDEWKVQLQSSPFGRTSSLGAATPTTVDEWEALVGEGSAP